MIKTQAIKLVYKEPMMITWDVGRRCNYDCTYCEASRHNNSSKHRSIDEMFSVLNFIQEYTKLYDCQTANINFTGGEPTSNPIFFDFVKQVKKQSNYGLGLTTNGAFSNRFIDTIEECFDWVTVSYHCEADTKLKERVLENIKELHKRNIRLSVNVMMHVDYWQESVNVCSMLTEHGIKFNPRPIGDGDQTIVGWFKDTNGDMRRTSHEYTAEQQNWYFNFMNLSSADNSNKQGTELGRNCCGGRCIKGKVDDQWVDVKLVDTNFKGWYCSVNKYFLHIDQETGLVYHHQTCQAKFNNSKGSIGSLNNTQEIFDYVVNNKNSTIVCPNNRCGCGMCVPKAKELSDYIKIIQQTEETFA